MAYTNVTLTWTASVQSIVEQGLQTPMPMWQQASAARLTSTQATLNADARVHGVIQSMSALQSWNIGNDLADGTDAALGSLMGSLGSLGELMSTGIGLTDTTTQTVVNADGSITVTSTVSHDPGVAKIMEKFADYNATPAGDAGVWLATQLTQGGGDVTDGMAAFSASLPQQIPDFVQAGAASGALGAGLVVNFSAYL